MLVLLENPVLAVRRLSAARKSRELAACKTLARQQSSKSQYDDGAPTGYTTFPKTMLSLYLLGFVGEFDWDTFDTYALRALICLFIFIVVIVLLNVLIAIVGESYANAREDKTRVGIYYRLKIELILETNAMVKYLPTQLRKIEDEDSIKQRLLIALKQQKDDTEADPVRESEERTKQELADVKRELAAMAATQQIILAKLQTILDDKQQP